MYFQKFCELNGWRPTEYAIEMYDVYWDSFIKKMVLFDGVCNLMEYLSNNSIKIAICTELTAHIQHKKIRKLKLDSFIDVLVTSEEAGSEKKSNRIFELTLEKLKANPYDVVYLGDDYELDVLGARRLGIDSYWYVSEKKEEEIKRIDEFKIVKDIDNFRTIIQKMGV